MGIAASAFEIGAEVIIEEGVELLAEEAVETLVENVVENVVENTAENVFDNSLEEILEELGSETVDLTESELAEANQFISESTGETSNFWEEFFEGDQERLSQFQQEMSGLREEYAQNELTQVFEEDVAEFGARQAVETGGTTISRQAQKAVYDHFSDIFEEIASGNFSRKYIQQQLLQRVTGKIDTGNDDANRIIQALGNYKSGGLAFSEINEAGSFLIDSLDHTIGLPPTLVEQFGGSVGGAAYTETNRDIGHIIDTVNKVSGTSITPPEKKPFVPHFTAAPQQDTRQSEPIVGRQFHERNHHINITSARGNEAPINDGFYMRTALDIQRETLHRLGEIAGVVDDLRPGENDRIGGSTTERLPGIKKPVENTIFYTPDGDIVPDHELEISHSIDPSQMGRDVGRLVGHAVNEFSSQRPTSIDLVESLALESLRVAGRRYPESRYLIDTVYNFLKRKEPDGLVEEYRQIRDVYNGKSISPNRVYRNAQGQLSIRDEVGKQVSYTGTQGNVPGYGQFCGPFSKNATEPVDLLDTFCMMHDTDYDDDGYFDTTADLKFVSRISQNLDRMGFQEQVIAKISMQYFLGVGIVLGELKTKYLPGNVDKEVVHTGFGGVDDIFTQLVPEKEDVIFASQGLQKSTTQRDESRKTFYAGVRQGVEAIQQQNTADVSGGGAVPSMGNSALYEAFKHLKIYPK